VASPLEKRLSLSLSLRRLRARDNAGLEKRGLRLISVPQKRTGSGLLWPPNVPRVRSALRDTLSRPRPVRYAPAKVLYFRRTDCDRAAPRAAPRSVSLVLCDFPSEFIGKFARIWHFPFHQQMTDRFGCAQRCKMHDAKCIRALLSGMSR